MSSSSRSTAPKKSQEVKQPRRLIAYSVHCTRVVHVRELPLQAPIKSLNRTIQSEKVRPDPSRQPYSHYGLLLLAVLQPLLST